LKATNSCSKYKFENLKSDYEIANYLALEHSKNCSFNSAVINERLKLAYSTEKDLLDKSNLIEKFFISSDVMDKAIQKIANGTTAGHDAISIEHFKFAHPSVPSIMKFIFNIFLQIGEVPLDFGQGLVTPIPKFKGSKKFVSSEDFRGITVNVIPSKIFEHCIAPTLVNLPSSSRQFGFKKGAGCANAISCVRNTIQYFNKRGNTLSVACVDIKKAFDKANIWGILRLLQQNHIAPNIIEVLKQWFLMSSARVKWNGILSEPVFLSSGVRQGGVLSPLLFSAYVDVVLSELGKSSLGCFINKRCFNSFMYADDLILLSISFADLQSLLSLSVEIFGTLDLQINAKNRVFKNR